MSHKNRRPSNHMVVRSQQRGIPEEMVDVLIDFGDSSYTNGGAISYCMSKKSKKRAMAGLGGAKYRELEHWMDCYTVVSPGGTVLTIAHRLNHRRN